MHTRRACPRSHRVSEQPVSSSSRVDNSSIKLETAKLIVPLACIIHRIWRRLTGYADFSKARESQPNARPDTSSGSHAAHISVHRCIYYARYNVLASLTFPSWILSNTSTCLEIRTRVSSRIARIKSKHFLLIQQKGLSFFSLVVLRSRSRKIEII